MVVMEKWIRHGGRKEERKLSKGRRMKFRKVESMPKGRVRTNIFTPII
jgi:hypothetical protein